MNAFVLFSWSKSHIFDIQVNLQCVIRRGFTLSDEYILHICNFLYVYTLPNRFVSKNKEIWYEVHDTA